ncbi:MAG: hypothetical protein IKT41_00995 [Clostridia bacterium]|nr:hypothetical protein [Clostridia bacterium]
MRIFKQILENNTNNNYFGITNYIENISSNITLDNSFTTAILKNLNLKWPEIKDDYIIKIINYLKFNKLIGDKNEKI